MQHQNYIEGVITFIVVHLNSARRSSSWAPYSCWWFPPDVVFSTHGAWSRGVADDLKRIARMKEIMDGQIAIQCSFLGKSNWTSMNSAIISLRKDSDLQRGRVFAAALEDYMINERRSGRYEV